MSLLGAESLYPPTLVYCRHGLDGLSHRTVSGAASSATRCQRTGWFDAPLPREQTAEAACIERCWRGYNGALGV